jgi:hypothetical protein
LFPSEPAHAGVSELVEVEGTEGIEKSYSIDDMMRVSKRNVGAQDALYQYMLSLRRNSATLRGSDGPTQTDWIDCSPVF